MAKVKKHIVLNALHSKVGGGFMYLQHILPHLAKDKDIKWSLLVQQSTKTKLDIPKNVEVIAVDDLGGFVISFLYEQFVLPFKMMKINYDSMLCNANYVPMFVKSPMPIIHSNCDVYHYAHNLFYKSYWLFMKYFTQVSVWRSSIVFSVAEHMNKQFACGKHLKKFHHTPPASNIAKGKTKRDNLTMLAAGDAYLQKNYVSLLKSFYLIKKQQPKAKLIIAGGFPFNDIERKIEAAVYALNLNDNVTFTGHVTYEEILKLYASCTLYVSASDAESFSMTLLEAMGSGCAIIAKDTVFNKEVAGDTIEYIASDANFENALADKVLWLFKNQKYSDKIGLISKTRAKKLSWQATAKTICDAVK